MHVKQILKLVNLPNIESDHGKIIQEPHLTFSFLSSKKVVKELFCWRVTFCEFLSLPTHYLKALFLLDWRAPSIKFPGNFILLSSSLKLLGIMYVQTNKVYFKKILLLVNLPNLNVQTSKVNFKKILLLVNLTNLKLQTTEMHFKKILLLVNLPNLNV